MVLQSEQTELSRLQVLLGLPEDFFTSCISLARVEARQGLTPYHQQSYFGMKNWHELVANINSKSALDEHHDWSFKPVKNLPIWVNEARMIAFFIAPMAKSGVSECADIELKRSFGIVAQSLCSNNEPELPFESSPDRITYSKVPREFEVWALVRQMESSESEILVEFVKFTQTSGILDRIPLSSIAAVKDTAKLDIEETPTSNSDFGSSGNTDVSSDIEIEIAEKP